MALRLFTNVPEPRRAGSLARRKRPSSIKVTAQLEIPMLPTPSLCSDGWSPMPISPSYSPDRVETGTDSECPPRDCCSCCSERKHECGGHDMLVSAPTGGSRWMETEEEGRMTHEQASSSSCYSSSMPGTPADGDRLGFEDASASHEKGLGEMGGLVGVPELKQDDRHGHPKDGAGEAGETEVDRIRRECEQRRATQQAETAQLLRLHNCRTAVLCAFIRNHLPALDARTAESFAVKAIVDQDLQRAQSDDAVSLAANSLGSDQARQLSGLSAHASRLERLAADQHTRYQAHVDALRQSASELRAQMRDKDAHIALLNDKIAQLLVSAAPAGSPMLTPGRVRLGEKGLPSPNPQGKAYPSPRWAQAGSI